MRSLSDTLARLTAVNGREFNIPPAAMGHLTPLEDFGSNPGTLAAFHFVPDDSGVMPLVVVLHGCTQNASGYDRGAGWTQLAEELGFAVLFPEQRRSNNFNLCFNWYESADSRRDAGEPMSIRQMVRAMVERFDIDQSRIFITGLSAGGAMTSVMLATYPDVFSGGAIVAGLPHGSAASLPEAFDRMRGHGGLKGAGLARLVSSTTTHSGPWPTISIWHGSADNIVDAANADAIIEQWRPLHGVGHTPSRIQEEGKLRRRSWCDASGRTVIEDWRIAGMGHGTPVCTRGDNACGTGGPYMLDVGISSTREIAKSWGLGEGKPSAALGKVAASNPVTRGPSVSPIPRAMRSPVVKPLGVEVAAGPSAVGKVIEDALRAAGLMK